MRFAYDAAEITKAEQPLLAELPDGTLMSRAATALARRCASVLGSCYGARVVVLVGSGNNGGDALFAAALLSRRGARVDALTASATVHEAGAAALRQAGGQIMPSGSDRDASLISAADLVIDGLVGIGASGALRGPHALLAELANATSGAVVSVDVPSGVDASTGVVEGVAVRADVTVTFGGLKPGLIIAPGAEHCGLIDVVDIGLGLGPSTVSLLDADDAAELLPRPEDESDKYRRGVVGVVAGSDTYTGAALLVVGGAAAAGAGMVRYVGTRGPAHVVRNSWPEAVCTVVDAVDAAALDRAGRVQAWVVGSGLGTDEAAADAVAAVLATDVPVVVDADGLTALAKHPEWLRERRQPTVLTPHAGEFARLAGVDRHEVEAHRLEQVRRLSHELQTHVLLKGSTTLVADAQGSVWVNSAQTPYLATAGSGDVLAGIIATLLAGGLPAAEAAAAGAFVHGLAGLHAAGQPAASFTATDIIRALPAALRSLETS
jgi:hydroxyethylthiazole kinase-like uncharacterized protein yjeF